MHKCGRLVIMLYLGGECRSNWQLPRWRKRRGLRGRGQSWQACGAGDFRAAGWDRQKCPLRFFIAHSNKNHNTYVCGGSHSTTYQKHSKPARFSTRHTDCSPTANKGCCRYVSRAHDAQTLLLRHHWTTSPSLPLPLTPPSWCRTLVTSWARDGLTSPSASVSPCRGAATARTSSPLDWWFRCECACGCLCACISVCVCMHLVCIHTLRE